MVPFPGIVLHAPRGPRGVHPRYASPMARIVLGILLAVVAGVWGLLLGGLGARLTAPADTVGWDALARGLGWMALGGGAGILAGVVAALRLAGRRLAPVLAAASVGAGVTLAVLVVLRLASAP